jgi:molybdopterin-containing oxidoreductase family iron-sulfur binding subunit
VSHADYWRSLEELARSPEGRAALRDTLRDEFPEGASEWDDPVGRRNFLRLMGASLALAGLAGCSPPGGSGKIVPYVRQPEQISHSYGKSFYYATACPHAGYGLGVLAESREFRPIKLEGNPQHPSSRGATDAVTQASILNLYDPDRSQTVFGEGRLRTWGAFLTAMRRLVEEQKPKRGAGLRFLTGAVTSPTLIAQFRGLLRDFPEAKWHQYEPAGQANARAGTRLAFGEDVHAVHNLDKADVVLSLDADFLGEGPGRVRRAADFATRRRVRRDNTSMSRLYVVESFTTITGAKADHRLPMRSRDVEDFARALAAALEVPGVGEAPRPGPAVPEEWFRVLVDDLRAARGRSLVLAGDIQPPVVHALAAAINDALGNTGKTVIYTETLQAAPDDSAAQLRELCSDIDAGRVSALVVMGCNPVFTAPADLEFAGRYAKVPLRVHLGLHRDETGDASTWHVPETHYLEAWSDIRSDDGTVTLMQPLIAPLYDTCRSAHELATVFTDRPDKSGHDLVKDHWRGVRRDAKPEDFEAWWKTCLHDGLVPDSAPRPREVRLRPVSEWLKPQQSPGEGGEGLEIVFRPDPQIVDGRYANNGWLMELPRPITRLMWDNVAHVSPATAERLGLRSGQLVDLTLRGRTVRAPVWVAAGNADDSVTVHFGFGRVKAGRTGDGVGFDAYAIRPSSPVGFESGLTIADAGLGLYPLASAQGHQRMEGRDIVRTGTIQEFAENPSKFSKKTPTLTLYTDFRYTGNVWGMVVDQTACIGCNACVVACQAENNIPIVGKAQTLNNREMHWLRIDAYFRGDASNPFVHFQPMMCVHCERAPCEVVCPVQATLHDAEGLNVMVYNRCVGTRYCSNNCPYKVRRFNWLQYNDETTEVLKLGRNPEVTVRVRGVMEKCTYCVQRISHARIEAKKDNRDLRDGEVLTACQAACPTTAIVFGNLRDPAAAVVHLKGEPHNYSVLGELGTEPKTTYLADIRNPSERLAVSD